MSASVPAGSKTIALGASSKATSSRKAGATPLLGVKLKKARDKEKEKKDVEGPAEGKSEEMVLG
jgi:hypothetical protein